MSSQDGISCKNTETEPQTDIQKIGRIEKNRARATASSISVLERDLASERDGRKEERFIWSLICIILFDVVICDKVGVHIIWILVLEFAFLFVFGRMCGVDYIYEETQKAIDTVARMRAIKKVMKDSGNVDECDEENKALPSSE